MMAMRSSSNVRPCARRSLVTHVQGMIGVIEMKILVTAGPTREPIDPVRFITNRSSGKMGYAVACEGVRRGHDVRVIAGPVSLPDPAGIRPVFVTTAQEMFEAVADLVGWCDALVMTAAVADFRPRHPSMTKLRKDEMPPSLELENTPDILSGIGGQKGARLFVGFAAETGDPIKGAWRKMNSKGLDLIVANDVTQIDAGFDVDTNRVTLIARDGRRESLPLMSKLEVATRIIRWLEDKMSGLKTPPG
jgi:phosphopantothenoylcysteine decarboxylase / phosphopantothenate---cysteine ligase